MFILANYYVSQKGDKEVRCEIG